MPTIDPLPAAAAPAFDLEQYLNTIEKLESLDPGILFYSHGGVGIEAKKRMRRVMENTRDFGEFILNALKQGENTQSIRQKVIERASAQFPPGWADDMVRVWSTGMSEGYTIYFRNRGLV